MKKKNNRKKTIQKKESTSFPIDKGITTENRIEQKNQSSFVQNSNVNNLESEEEILKRKLKEYGGKKSYISSVFQDNSSTSNANLSNQNNLVMQQKTAAPLNSPQKIMQLPPLPKKLNNIEITENALKTSEIVSNKNTPEIKIDPNKNQIVSPLKTNLKNQEETKIKQLHEELSNELFSKIHPVLKKDQKILDSYDIIVDRAKIKVEIIKDPFGTVYNIYLPKISPATMALLDEIRNELISVTTISMQELTDASAFNVIKDRFMNDARNILREKLPNINQYIEDFLVGILMQEMLGLGSIEFLLNDQSLEEIVIPSAKENIRVYSKKFGWLVTNIRIEKEEEIINYSNIIARRVGRQITVLSPLLDAHLVTGDRVNAVLYPIGTKGNTITVRKFSRDPFTIVDFINSKTCDADVASLIWLAIEYEMNILISGGTGSGKTSFLNACMHFIPPNQRIISIEDTRELMLPEFLYWAPLVTRTPNPEGKGEVSMLDLLVNSLRMRPDRIILGEMRRQQEAMVLFEAMHTGHSVYATVHADTAAETISRLVNPPLSVPPNLLKAVNLNVVMFRDRRRGIRRILQIAEFEAGKDEARANILYRWVPDEDRLKLHGESSRFFEDIGRHTGLADSELKKDLAEKKRILLWMVKHNIRKLQDFGKILNYYYKNKEFLMNGINREDVRGILGG